MKLQYDNQTEAHIESAMLLSELRWAHDYLNSTVNEIDDNDFSNNERILSVDNKQIIYTKNINDSRLLIESNINNCSNRSMKLSLLGLNFFVTTEDPQVVQRAHIMSRNLANNSIRQFVFYEDVDEDSDYYGSIGVIGRTFRSRANDMMSKSKDFFGHVYHQESKILDKSEISKINNLLPTYEVVF